MEKILVIDDEQEIRESLAEFLLQHGFEVSIAKDGIEGMKKFHTENYDLILLDVMMPSVDGYAVLQMIRQLSAVPVIMITARGETDDQLKGFDLKADDYIVKPFAMEILLRRIQLVLRRNAIHQEKNPLLKFGELTLDTQQHLLFVNAKKITLTHKEFQMMELFLSHPQTVFSRDKLLDTLWGKDYIGSEAIINVHIKNLRKKLGINVIQSVRGVGYKLDKED